MRSTVITRCYHASKVASTLATSPNPTPTHHTHRNSSSDGGGFYGVSGCASTLAAVGWWA